MKFTHKASALLLALTLGTGAVFLPTAVSAQEDPNPGAVTAEPASDELDISEIDGEFDDADLEIGETDWEFTPEELAEFNAETDALINALVDAGISVERVVDEDGFVYPEFGEDLTDADGAQIESVFTEFFGDELDISEFDDADLEIGETDWEFTPEELAEFNAETDALINALVDAG
ncbi:MAG: hypothetical protein GY708_23055, partial [Actinomycetia bacterium]|nr:hypothetical protein [Actinomycetes bacterium]